MARYVVAGPQAVVIVAGRRVYLGCGAVVPEGADEARLAHLVALGLVSEVPEESEGTESEGTESEGTESEGTESEGTESEGTESKPATRGKTR